jgi:hypothetical protein
MIQPQFKARFEGDSGVDVGTQEIDAIFPDGEKRRVVLRVGSPFKKEDFVCIRAELENLDRTDGPLCGEGTLHALVIGIAFIIGRLEIFEQRHGCRYFWPDSDDQLDYRQIFSTLDSKKEPNQPREPTRPAGPSASS